MRSDFENGITQKSRRMALHLAVSQHSKEYPWVKARPKATRSNRDGMYPNPALLPKLTQPEHVAGQS